MIEKRFRIIFVVLCVLLSSIAMGCLGDDKEQVVVSQPQPQNVTYVQSAGYHDNSNFWETMYLLNMGNQRTEVRYVQSPSYSSPSSDSKTVNNYYSSSKTTVKDVKPSTSKSYTSSYKATSNNYKPSTRSYSSSSSSRSYSSSSSGSRSYSSGSRSSGRR